MAMRMYTIGDDILNQWHWIEPELARCKDRALNAHLTTAHWLADILAGHSFILVCEDNGEPQMVAILEPSRTTLHLEAWAGKGLKQYLPQCLEHIQSIARGLGVKYITSKSRPGAAKQLQKVGGYKVHDYYMKCEVIP